MFEALVGNEPATEKFLGVMAGTVGLADFFAPGNIKATIGARKARLRRDQFELAPLVGETRGAAPPIIHANTHKQRCGFFLKF